MSTTAQILQLITDLLGGGSDIVTKAEHKPVLDAIANSLLNKETDIDLLGLLKHDPLKPYIKGVGTLKDGQLWQANEAIPIEPFNPSKWTQITGFASLSDYGIAEWENDFPSGSGGGYPIGAQVVRDERLWTSDIASNTADPLVSDWTEISANDGNYGNDWVVGLYKQYQTITDPTDRRLYYVAAASNFNSIDLAAEIIAGDFLPVPSNGVLTGTENNTIRFDAVGVQEESDAIKNDGTNIEIKENLIIPNDKIITLGSTDQFTLRFNSISQRVELYSDAEAKVVFSVAADVLGDSFRSLNYKIMDSGFLGNIFTDGFTDDHDFELPDKDIKFAGLEDIITQISETVTTLFGTTVTLTTVPGATYTAPADGKYRFTFTAAFNTSNDSTGLASMYKNGVAEAGCNRTLLCFVSGSQTGNVYASMNISKTLTLVATDVVDIKAQLLAGSTVNVESGIWRVEKMPD